MQVEVSGTAQQRLEQLMERGEYSTASDAVASAIEALWLEVEHAEDDIDALVDEAMADVEAGRTSLLTSDLAAEVSRAGRERLANRGSSLPR